VEELVFVMSNELDEDRFCIACGYNLRGLTSEQCPDCGLPIDTARGSAVAWEGRKEIGTVRAFRRTMMEGMFHVKRLAHAVARPVDSRSAKGFRIIVSLLATVPASILFCLIVHAAGGTGFLSVWQPNTSSWPFTSSPFPSRWEIPILWSAGATILPVLPIGAFISVFLSTGLQGLWVRGEGMPEERRKRGVALSAYVGAPLALLIVPTAAFGIAWGTWDSTDPLILKLCTASLDFGVICCAVIAGVYLISAVKLIAALSHDGWVRKACAIAGLPLCWIVAVGVGMVGVPMLVGLVWVMVDSLRS
jgi:hypothetical protein